VYTITNCVHVYNITRSVHKYGGKMKVTAKNTEQTFCHWLAYGQHIRVNV